MSELDNTNVSALLGKAIAAPRTYDKNILVREPRQSNRKHLGINDHALPFVGYDVWNAWEISTLTESGCPVTAIAKIVYSAASKYIVESKSLKLYFNSFNMTVMGNTAKVALSKMKEYTEKDLSLLLECSVAVHLFSPQNIPNSMNWYGHRKEWQCLDNLNNETRFVEISQYKEAPSLLKTVKFNSSTEKNYWSTFLRSNCRVTKQQDTGDVFITVKSNYVLDEQSLLEYICSFRDEAHFHEEVAEAIYKRLWDKLTPEELVVCCMYNRRGGICIHPIRASHEHLIDDWFVTPDCPFVKGPRG